MMTHKHLTVITLCIFAFLATFITWNYFSKPYLTILPANATDIEDHFVDLFVDFEYFLTAKISEKEFAKVVSRIGAKESVGSSILTDGSAPEWWVPPPEGVIIFKREPESSMRKKVYVYTYYVGGKLYLVKYST